MIVVFGVRNCKVRGILIESIDFGDNNTYFFKIHNQSLVNHCTQIQNIIRASNVKHFRKIPVDIGEFVHEYFNPAENTAWFRGIKLDYKYQQINRTMSKRLNIDVGIEKRKYTIAEKKAAKALEKQRQTDQFNAGVEKQFQEERAKRIKAIHDAAKASQAAQAAHAAQQALQDSHMKNSDI